MQDKHIQPIDLIPSTSGKINLGTLKIPRSGVFRGAIMVGLPHQLTAESLQL
jgi:hypothetical protein